MLSSSGEIGLEVAVETEPDGEVDKIDKAVEESNLANEG